VTGPFLVFKDLSPPDPLPGVFFRKTLKRDNKMDIGTDIIEIDRIDRLLKKYPNFRSRFFTDREISYCEHKKYPAQHYAARFAGKESILKALGNEQGEIIRFRDLEIINSRSGKPEVYLHNQAYTFSQKHGIKTIKISLSHCKTYAVAVTQIIT
jgi:holo-[acyl-carrier protein] synthase